VVELMYHGLDLTRFMQPTRDWSEAEGEEAERPVQLLSVGRAVEKKGYDDLLHALARLPVELSWQLTHIGGGPEHDKLTALAKRLAIDTRIRWLGARAQQEVLDTYRASDLFVLASKVASDGDRDGLPNVIVEAQSQGLAVVATNVSAIPELIRDGVNGRLVSPGAPEALAVALEQMIRAPGERRTFGQAGMKLVHGEFSMEKGIDRLTEMLVAVAAEQCPWQATAADAPGSHGVADNA
jgi:glycosyltransferase involved in cell wall biosynthesis